MIKRLLIIWLIVSACLPAAAVLKEKDLASTLAVLRAELENTYREQRQNMARYEQRTQQQHREMIALMQRSDQTALMLYSQKQDFTFDMTYACHEATDQYREFSKRRMPYDRILARINSEVERYNDLIESLQTIPPSLVPMKRTDGKTAPQGQPQGQNSNPAPQGHSQNGKGRRQPFMLDAAGQADRMACLTYAKALRNNLVRMRKSIVADNQHYNMVAEKLKKINDFAEKRYSAIQHNIFVNGDDSYFAVLAALPMSFSNARTDFREKYDTETVTTHDGRSHVVHSQWRGPIVFGLSTFVIFYIILAGALSNVLIRWIVPKRFRTEEFLKKKVCIILAVAMIIFAVTVMIAREFMTHNFFLMASRLLIEYAWLLGAIFVSLLIRLPGSLIKSGFKVYTPVMLMAFIVISFRIVFIPNNIVQLIFPPILLLFTVWQWWINKHTGKALPRPDMFYSYISLTLMIVSTCAAWYGYTLLAVQILIWWMFQLTCIQTITCIYDLLAAYERRFIEKRMKKEAAASAENTTPQQAATVAARLKAVVGKAAGARSQHAEYINVTWLFDLVSMALVPVLGVFTILMSIWWASDVFDLTATVASVFFKNYINIPGIVELSLAKVVTVTSLFFIFRYINYLLRALYHRYRRPKVAEGGRPNFTLANNIIAITVWGLYFIISIKMLKIPSTAISLISAGLATGVGFAMKDLLENFFYGISLMTGRVRVGDFIECDGIRGKVDSITYQSTQVATADGCVIAFLNSSLFNKNFKNITKNHSYELVKVPVGVAYGTNIDQVRTMLTDCVRKLMRKNDAGLDVISTTKPVGVVFDDFGESSVNLFVTYWVLVEDKFLMTCRVKEAIYNTLNANNIEMPFPQRDVHVYPVGNA